MGGGGKKKFGLLNIFNFLAATAAQEAHLSVRMSVIRLKVLRPACAFAL